MESIETTKKQATPNKYVLNYRICPSALSPISTHAARDRCTVEAIANQSRIHRDDPDLLFPDTPGAALEIIIGAFSRLSSKTTLPIARAGPPTLPLLLNDPNLHRNARLSPDPCLGPEPSSLRQPLNCGFSAAGVLIRHSVVAKAHRDSQVLRHGLLAQDSCGLPAQHAVLVETEAWRQAQTEASSHTPRLRQQGRPDSEGRSPGAGCCVRNGIAVPSGRCRSSGVYFRNSDAVTCSAVCSCSRINNEAASCGQYLSTAKIRAPQRFKDHAGYGPVGTNHPTATGPPRQGP